ncbi:hypothetical protein BDA99DRAFT_536325 [Phascolomyces articulosus]|uniref:K Homology domain-containing protein n=1 Tax=Phascolomyces articulosus TaxID=60185 RepID=A0AAD5K391_9FUNG|nr:hypothetical protein BDA99DRAFT_536325 [Phascolomyces articulosus]
MHFGRRRFEMVLENLNDDSNPITLRALIPSKMIGALIGKQGYIHKQIQDVFKVHIYILAWGDHYGRIANVFGSASAVSGAWRDALFRMYGSHESFLYCQTFQITFLVPAPLIDHMIENRVLEKIYEETKTGILLKRDPIQNSTDHLLTISINSMEFSLLNLFEKAVYMLALEFQEHPEKVMSPYNVYYLPPLQDRQHHPQQHQYQPHTPSPLSPTTSHNNNGMLNDTSTSATGGGEHDDRDHGENQDDYPSTQFNSNNSISSNSSIRYQQSNLSDLKEEERKKKMDIVFPLEVEDDQQWHEEFNNEFITPN